MKVKCGGAVLAKYYETRKKKTIEPFLAALECHGLSKEAGSRARLGLCLLDGCAGGGSRSGSIIRDGTQGRQWIGNGKLGHFHFRNVGFLYDVSQGNLIDIRRRRRGQRSRHLGLFWDGW